MSPLLKIMLHLPMLVVSLILLILLSQATPTLQALPTLQASQISSLSKDLSPRTQPLERAFHTRGTFVNGLWSIALTTATFLAQGPYSSTVPASDMENFAQQVLERVATKIATGAAEKAACGWVLEGVTITFRSWMDTSTHVTPVVPWAVVQDFVIKFVLWRAERGSVMAFSGNIWGPAGQCIRVVLQTGGAGAGSSILDSASEIHGNG